MSNLKKPLQALLMAPEWHSKCESGEKKITIRQGLRGYQLEKTVLCCHIKSWCILVHVLKVQWRRVCDIPTNAVKQEGFDTHHELLVKLKEYYPDLTIQSWVTVIWWE